MAAVAEGVAGPLPAPDVAANTGTAGSTGWRSQAMSARSSIRVARNKDRTLNMEALPSSRFCAVAQRPRDHLTLDGRAIGIARGQSAGSLEAATGGEGAGFGSDARLEY